MRAVIFWACSIGASTALAQTPAPPETTGTPAKRPPPVQPAKPPAVQRAPSPTPAAPPAGSRTVTVSRFVFRGNTVFSSEQLSAVVKDYLNRPLTLVEVYEAADRVTAFYAEQGYTLASATVPAQKISDGSVQLEILEGRIGSVTVQGTHSYTPEQVTANLGTFTAGQLYKGDQLEAGLRKLNRLPGLSAKAVLQPGTDYGTTALLIDANEQRINASAGVDNYGRVSLGRERYSLAGAFNNPFGLADQIQLMVLGSDGLDLKYGMLGYNVPLWTQGPRLGVSFADARFDASIGPSAVVTGENKVTQADLSYPVIDHREDLLVASLGASYTDANADLAGNTITQTHLPLYDVSGVYTHTYPGFAVTQVSLTLQSNFDHETGTATAPATPDCPGSQCRDVALRAQLDLQHLQPIWRRLDGYVQGTYVYSDEPLPDVVQFTLGGPNSVRAFPAAELRGDRGSFGSVGLRQGFFLGKAVTHLRVFGDVGQVECLSALCNGHKEGLSSYGGGFDFVWPAGRVNVNGKADVSWPLDKPNSPLNTSDTATGDPRVFATIGVTY